MNNFYFLRARLTNSFSSSLTAPRERPSIIIIIYIRIYYTLARPANKKDRTLKPL